MLEGETSRDRQIREQVDEYWTEVIGDEMTPRKALQLFGTECIREVFDDDVWSASLINRYRKGNKPDTVVTDCRFKNEVQAIKNNDGYVIRIQRGLDPEWLDEYMELVEDSNWYEIGVKREHGFFPHVSETDWIGSEFDYTLINDGTLDVFYESIDELMFLLDEKELSNKIEGIIDSILERGIIIDRNSKISGERFLNNGHRSLYNIFNGIDNFKKPNEKVKVIVEVWNCGFKGDSIICLGYSQTTDNNHNNSNINTIFWEKIIGDLSGTFGEEQFMREDALIYNIICH